jgi:hypothetical protein
MLIPRASAETKGLPMNLEEQNLKYKSEIERIWKAQFDSLSRKEVIDDENEDVPKVRQEPLPPAFRHGSPHYQDRDNREKSVGPDGNRRVLRIQRLVSICLNTETPGSELTRPRSMASGKPKLSATQLSSRRMFVCARQRKMKQPCQIRSHQQAMSTKI